jgi:hypothetical protein
VVDDGGLLEQVHDLAALVAAEVTAHPVAGGRLLADLARRLDRSARPTARPESELAAKRTRRPARPDPGCVD